MQKFHVGIFRSQSLLAFDVTNFPQKSNVLLIAGLSGSGKSTLSAQLALRCHAIHFKTDWLLYPPPRP